jgi:glutathione peroxidase
MPALDQEVIRIDGRPERLSEYRGKVLLIVNTASRCGFTGQYEGLEALQRRYGPRGLVVMGFPCNEFLGQEPGSNEEILEFCRSSFDVSFPLFAKIAVKPGPEQSALYRVLTEEGPEALRGPIKWNFTKFLVDPEGRVIGRFEPAVSPEDPDLISAIEAVLPAD